MGSLSVLATLYDASDNVRFDNATLSELGGDASHINHTISPEEGHFFEYYYPTPAMLPSSIGSTDFFDCLYLPDELIMFTNWIFHSLFPDMTVLHCSSPYDWPPSRPSLSPPRAYVALVRGGILHSFDGSLEFDESSFPVTTSLAISPCTSDFVGEMKMVDLRMGGIANGLETIHPSINLCITSEENQNLIPAKKRLLHWNSKFEHHNVSDVHVNQTRV